MRTSPKSDNSPKAKSPTSFISKQLFSPRSKSRHKSSSTLNVRRFSTDSVFSSQTMKADRSTAVGRRLSKDATFLSGSPPDINSRRSSYLDMIGSSSSKLSGKSPVLSIENVSDSCREPARKLSDSECIGRKLATLPRSDTPQDRQRLQTRHSIAIGCSDQTLNPQSNLKYDTWNTPRNVTKSAQNIPDSEREITVNVLNLTSEQRSNLSDDEIARRNKLTINQLQTQFSSKSETGKAKSYNSNTTNNNKAAASNPPRIHVEDTSKPELPPRKLKSRHKSLGEDVVPVEPKQKRHRITEQSRSLDSKPPNRDRSRSSSPRYLKQSDLPPAPPPPNCSPRNCTGRSPLDRLSKDELVNLWRSSESEIRSHLLKAIRDKEPDKAEDPP